MSLLIKYMFKSTKLVIVFFDYEKDTLIIALKFFSFFFDFQSKNKRKEYVE